jgi:hypothetical protein
VQFNVGSSLLSNTERTPDVSVLSRRVIVVASLTVVIHEVVELLGDVQSLGTLELKTVELAIPNWE